MAWKENCMKLWNLVICVLGLADSMCFAAESKTAGVYTGTVWAEGVSREDGWKDVDKSLDGVDNNMCYAASATNLITWWQDGYYGSRLTSSAPRDINAIWNTYKDNNIYPASAGEPLAAINWWISGVYAPADAAEEQRSLFNPVENASLITLKPFPGFYYDEYGLNKGDLGAFLGFSTEYTGTCHLDACSVGADVIQKSAD